MSAEETQRRETGRARIFDGAHELAAALLEHEGSERWEPLRDLVLAGLEAGGLRHADDGAALRNASGELASAALDARRYVGRTTASASDRRSEPS